MTGMSAITHSERKVPADTLAARVLLIRHEKGWSQREAAMACKVPFGTWQGIELGRGTRDLMKHIAAIAEGSGYDREWIAWGGALAQEPPGGGGGLRDIPTYPRVGTNTYTPTPRPQAELYADDSAALLAA